MPAKKGNKYAVGNKGGGRKSAYLEEYAELAYKYCLLGATDEELAANFDVSERTINTWKATHKEFSSALKEGKDTADAEVVHSLYRKAVGYDYDEDVSFVNKQGKRRVKKVKKQVQPETAAICFWLKNRTRRRANPWQDGFKHEVNVVNLAQAVHEAISGSSNEKK